MTLISPNQLNTRCILLICAHFIHLSREIITILGRVLICASDALDCVVILAHARVVCTAPKLDTWHRIYVDVKSHHLTCVKVLAAVGIGTLNVTPNLGSVVP